MCDRVQRHLLGCAACRDDVNSLRMAVEVLRTGTTLPTAGEEMLRRSLTRLAAELEITRREAEAPGQLVLGIPRER